jgi:hypothetical protein
MDLAEVFGHTPMCAADRNRSRNAREAVLTRVPKIYKVHQAPVAPVNIAADTADADSTAARW